MHLYTSILVYLYTTRRVKNKGRKEEREGRAFLNIDRIIACIPVYLYTCIQVYNKIKNLSRNFLKRAI